MDISQNVQLNIETITRELQDLKTDCLKDIHQVENKIEPLNFQLKFFSKDSKFKIFHEELLTYLECLYIGMAAARSGLVQRTLKWDEVLTRTGIQLLLNGASSAVGPFGLIMTLAGPVIDSFVSRAFDEKSIDELNHAFNRYITDISMVKRINHDIAYNFTFFYQEQIIRCVNPADAKNLAIACGEKFKKVIFKQNKQNESTLSLINNYLTTTLSIKTKSEENILFVMGPYPKRDKRYTLPTENKLWGISYDPIKKACSYHKKINKKNEPNFSTPYTFNIIPDTWCYNDDKDLDFAILVLSQRPEEFYLKCYVPIADFSRIQAFSYYCKNSNSLFRMPIKAEEQKKEYGFKFGYVTFQDKETFNKYIAANKRFNLNSINTQLKEHSYEILDINVNGDFVPSNLLDQFNKMSNALIPFRNMNALIEVIEKQNKVIKEAHDFFSEQSKFQQSSSYKPIWEKDLLAAYKNYSLFKNAYRDPTKRNQTETQQLLNDVIKQLKLMTKLENLDVVDKEKIEKRFNKLNNPEKSWPPRLS